ncbi:DUF3325 domain-containing protein [Variovorax sp. RHLX14]|uniref:DUF3325 domain-containing protein n=1 Tax=Variovorax sp. RHLX14 TaxID=1259731 RepID=UPI003F4777B9
MNSHVVVFALCLGAFAGIALAVERQQEELFGRALSIATTRLLRIAGWTGLMLAFAVAVRAQGWAFGGVAWVGHLSLAAGCVFGAMVIGVRLRTGRPV